MKRTPRSASRRGALCAATSPELEDKKLQVLLKKKKLQVLRSLPTEDLGALRTA